MSDCCTHTASESKTPKKLACPVNHLKYVQVPVKTLLHHLKEPWKYYLKDQGYYFCDEDDCDVAYFAEDGFTINKAELRTPLTKTDKSEDKVICYCFGVTLHDIKTNPDIKAFVRQHTKQGNCACESSNPSGRCCLKDFP